MPAQGRKPWRSAENRSFSLAMSQSRLLVFKQYQALGKFRCRPEIHGLAKDCCRCHMSDLLKITLIQKLNVFSWQWWSICVKEEIFQRHKINLVVRYKCLIHILQKGWVQQVWGGFQQQCTHCTERGGCEVPLKGLLFQRRIWTFVIILDALKTIT